ncbi:Pycsar system effector family protein [Actinosynnema pretiosum]|uniref:Pycsar effector protein domain-containing protein n=1 Tax=Actinosynnema pretiosum TaxID=42197 RepID=A0A290Z3P0_9PSEU|nr:Pycsar system effector family protein [Actinosynnema pretiosum]ATE53617.1 hypothetical protein CNX65_10205 [Actinosynnema pretiosum]
MAEQNTTTQAEVVSAELFKRLDAAGAEAAAQVARGDSKSFPLLPFPTTFLLGAVALVKGTGVPLVAEMLLWASAGAMLVAVLTLLGAISPRLSRRAGWGLTCWAQHVDRPADLLAALGAVEISPEVLAEDVARLSERAVARYRLVQVAITATAVGLVLGAGALAVIAVAA